MSLPAKHFRYAKLYFQNCVKIAEYVIGRPCASDAAHRLHAGEGQLALAWAHQDSMENKGRARAQLRRMESEATDALNRAQRASKQCHAGLHGSRKRRAKKA
jgi:hypothetical protein